MERELDRWMRMYQCIRQVCPKDHNRRHLHADSLIAGVLLWAALHERPVSWACCRGNWPARIRPKHLPSQPCMSRRLRTCSMAALLERAYLALREQLPAGMLKFIDAKPLPVGFCTKDDEARYGYAAGAKAKGYKLYAIVDAVSGAVETWQLGPMNYPEPYAAVQLLPRCGAGALIVGDCAYDAKRLYDQADSLDQCLLAQFKRGANGKGHHPKSRGRFDALAIAQTSAGVYLLEARKRIERTFGHLTSSSGGLLGLPAWVRTPHRVATWVAAKLFIDLDRRLQLHLQKEIAA